MKWPNRAPVLSAAHLVLFRETEVLLLRRENTGYEDGNYSVVAGHIEASETVRQTTVREALEEANLTLATADLDIVHVVQRLTPNAEMRIDFFVRASKWTGEISNREPHKCGQIAWFERDHLPHNLVPYVRHALDEIRRGSHFSEFGWEYLAPHQGSGE
jgi:8-oxo-dGTP diphosphatase